ncbi:MAG: LPS export ABC transporter periplasmic protein LptC [Myxococcota bacterium]|nr:LPS export ABC transporter periplasmic protein LptC [Myxococcota bacterium]
MLRDRRTLHGLCALALAVALGADAARAQSPLDLDQKREAVESEVRLAGMTYVSSRGQLNDMVLDAESARILPEREVAHLEGVRVRLVSATGGDGGLDMTCDTGLFEFDTGDFLAVGNVDGTTGDGRKFRTSRVRYKHEGALVTTDEPVEIRDETGTYRGGGFRYFLEENRFRMLGGASVIQE